MCRLLPGAKKYFSIVEYITVLVVIIIISSSSSSMTPAEQWTLDGSSMASRQQRNDMRVITSTAARRQLDDSAKFARGPPEGNPRTA